MVRARAADEQRPPKPRRTRVSTALARALAGGRDGGGGGGGYACERFFFHGRTNRTTTSQNYLELISAI